MVALSLKESFHDMLHWESFDLRGSIHFFVLVPPFLCSMLSEGVLVFKGSVLLSCICLGRACEFCALFCGFLSTMCSRLSCVEPLPISLGIEIFFKSIGHL